MTLTTEQLLSIPELKIMAELAVSLQPAHVQATEHGTTVIIDFADEKERDLFLEAVKFVQAHRSAQAK